MRAHTIAGPFALIARQGNAERIHHLNKRAERLGLHPGMALADTRAFCPDLISRLARPDLEARFLATLHRWAGRYCPWVGHEGTDGLVVLDITRSSFAKHGAGQKACELPDAPRLLTLGALNRTKRKYPPRVGWLNDSN